MSTATAEILTLDDAARELVCSVEQVRQLCVKGKLPFVNIGTGDKAYRRIRRDDLEKFKRGQIQEQTAWAVRAAKRIASGKQAYEWV